ncbi:MAG: hypothetical protein ACJ71T_05690 [Actinomycetales bacterium]
MACALTWSGALLHIIGLRYGSTAAERRCVLASDKLVPNPSLVTNHAITIDVAADQVWPWLTQMGWHRAGWYTPRWVDRLLFPGNWPSAQFLDPGLVRDLRPGDTMADGPPGTAGFVVQEAQPPYLLVLHSTTHLPPHWRERYGARLSWSWTFRLQPVDEGRTRLLVRTRGRVHPGWLDIAYRAFVTPADGVMATAMLRGLKGRVENTQLGRKGRRTLPA